MSGLSCPQLYVVPEDDRLCPALCWSRSGERVVVHLCGTPIEVKKYSITSSARSCRTVGPGHFWELQVSACVLVFRGVSWTVAHDMHSPLVLRPGMGMEKQKLNRVRH